MKNDKDWLHASVLGAMGNTAIEDVLKKRFHVYRFGYESTLQNLTQSEEPEREDVPQLLRTYSDAFKMIQCMPDFILVDKKDKSKRIFLEVTTNRSEGIKQLCETYRAGAKYFRTFNLARFYSDAKVINILWNPENPQIYIYSVKREGDSLKFIDIPIEEFMTSEDKEMILALIRRTAPPPLSFGGKIKE
jgi:hypothetical protein